MKYTTISTANLICLQFQYYTSQTIIMHGYISQFCKSCQRIKTFCLIGIAPAKILDKSNQFYQFSSQYWIFKTFTQAPRSNQLNVGFLQLLPRLQGQISSMMDFYNFFRSSKVKSARCGIFTTFTKLQCQIQSKVGTIAISGEWSGQHDIDYCRLPPEAQPKSNFSAKTVFTFVTPNSKRNALQANNLNMTIFKITYATAKPKLAAKSHQYLDYCWEMEHLQYFCDYPQHSKTTWHLLCSHN